MDEAQLRTVWQQRQMGIPAAHLSQPLGVFVKRNLARRVRRIGQLSAIWDEVVPEEIAEHTALEGFRRGVLTVMVDSAPHRYRLQTLLTGGLMKEIQARFSGALNKVRLIPGQFASVDLSGDKRFEF